jgi:hypothetical protein
MPLTWDIPTVVRTNSDGSKETIPCRTSGARGSCDEYGVNTPGGGATTYTCSAGGTANCVPTSQACPLPGSGTCPTGQKCCNRA